MPDVSDGGALLSVEATSVCGTDIGLYRGQSHFESLPIVLGHEVAGRIVDAAPETLDRWGVDVGDRVMPEPYLPCYECQNCQTGNYHMCEQDRCYGVSISADRPPHLWGGYGEYMYLHPDTWIHPVADAIPSKAACLGSVVGNGVRWVVEKGEIDPEDSVAIIGPGAQGLASVIVADQTGADPLVLMGLSSDEHRLALGEQLGATHTLYTDDDDVEEQVLDVTDGGPDVVIVTAPASPAITLGLDVVRPRGRVVLPGLVDEDVAIDTNRLVVDEISLVGGRGQALNVERAMDVLERRTDDVEAINTHSFPIFEAETAIRQQIPGDEHNADLIHAVLESDSS
ncbi:MAG: zinc-binding dehydrogenase [Haloplanus sp.]